MPVTSTRAPDRIRSTLADFARLVAAGRPCCATFEVPGNKRAWAQVTADTVNVSYPYEGDPEEWLPIAGLHLPDGMRQIAWKPYVFIEFSYADPAPLAEFLHACFTLLLKQEGDRYPLVSNAVQV